MGKLVAKNFQNRARFYQSIVEQTDQFDLEASLGMPYFCYQKTDGKQFHFKILKHFLASINNECGTKYLISRCATRRNSFVIFVEEEEKAPVVETVEQVVEAPVETVTAEAPTPEAPESTPKVDLEKAKALYDSSDKKASKLALDTYAAEFGIELNRAKSFDNMIKELVEKTA